MPAYPREEMEEMWDRWLAANDEAEANNDWARLGPFYAEDASYTWKVGRHMAFAAHGRKDIVDHVMGFEMIGFDDWTYPYEKVVIDDSRGQAVGYWRQVTPHHDANGNRIKTNGLGCSWFEYAGNYQWSEQLDVFDVEDIQGVLSELDALGKLPEEMKQRQKRYVDGTAPGSVFV